MSGHSAETTLILASGSPRRKGLLHSAGFVFTVVVPEVEEIEDPSIPIKELTSLNARIKGREISEANPDSVILSADTLVLLGDVVFGKPSDRREAEEMLGQLNGKTHQVFTAFCLMKKSTEQRVEITVTTEVTFKNLTLPERRAYHRLIEPLDKAGAYAAQDHGEKIIEKISGSPTNVIGLPMDEVTGGLNREFGIAPGG